MSVIIFENENGGVSMCIPTGEMPIDQVLAKDCPPGAIVIDRSSLPMDDFDLFDAWELKNNQVQINIDKAIAQQQTRLNQVAKREAAQRSANVMIGVANVPQSDADFVALINNHRAVIAGAKTTQELRTAVAAAMSELNASGI